MFDLDVFRTPEVVSDLSTYDRFVIAFSGGKDIGGSYHRGEVQHVIGDFVIQGIPDWHFSWDGQNYIWLVKFFGHFFNLWFNIRDRAFKKITEISPGTSLKNARPSKARKGQPVELV
jgi:hypothetical protein